jgi:GrpB-like predicted nucleotidyltransferase (UPF0157 family)
VGSSSNADSVKIVDADPAWGEKFERGAAMVRAALGALVLGIEHIGSTSVPGLAAKPVVDMLVGLPSMPDVLAAPARLVGWEFPEAINAKLDDRRFGKLAPDGERTHHVHIVVFDADEWRRLVAFRNALRASPELAERYEDLKRDLAARFADEREKYTAAKTDFVAGVLRSVGAPLPRGVK